MFYFLLFLVTKAITVFEVVVEELKQCPPHLPTTHFGDFWIRNIYSRSDSSFRFG